ncbi:hypothetical protein Lesp02_29980 [Lentzea sp. NBRC 105346]|nr:hypothetical protein Lesp02_29980 [Lentzea sp. NBRC 105346]
MDLISPYSNRTDLLFELETVIRKLTGVGGLDSGQRLSVQSDEHVAQRTTFGERLGEDGVAELAAAYLDGATQSELAQRYGTGEKTIRRLLREIGARKRRPRAA